MAHGPQPSGYYPPPPPPPGYQQPQPPSYSGYSPQPPGYGFPPPPYHNYATLGDRALAMIIDTIIMYVIIFVLIFVFIFSMLSTNFMFVMFSLPVIALMTFLPWIYFIAFEAHSGQTPGKKIAHIKVVDISGRDITLNQALIRNILRLVDGLLYYVVAIIFIEMVYPYTKQRLGDKLANTVVIKV